MDKLISMILTHLKGHKVGYILAVLLGIIVVTDTPIRTELFHLVNIASRSAQVHLSDQVDDLNENVGELMRTSEIADSILNDMQVFQWQSIITNEALPTILRLQAYDAYTGSGHNSWVHDYYESELKPLNTKAMKYRLHELRREQGQ